MFILLHTYIVDIFQSRLVAPITVFCHLSTSRLLSAFKVKAVCLSLQDSNVLVQRNMLEILLYFFPFAECLVGTHRNTLTYSVVSTFLLLKSPSSQPHNVGYPIFIQRKLLQLENIVHNVRELP